MFFDFRPYFGKNAICHYELNDIVDNAHELTSASNDGKNLFDNLKYRMNSTGQMNWNSLEFEYVTDEPLSQVKSKLTRAKFLIAFRNAVRKPITVLFERYRYSAPLSTVTPTFSSFYGG